MKAKPDGSTYVDKTWGYVMEKHQGRWVRQHRLRMERKLGRKLGRWEVVHHKDHDRANNRLHNLQLMPDGEHRSYHATGKKLPEATKRKMQLAALRVAADPAERKRRSERAKRQHEAGNFGRATWRLP